MLFFNNVSFLLVYNVYTWKMWEARPLSEVGVHEARFSESWCCLPWTKFTYKWSVLVFPQNATTMANCWVMTKLWHLSYWLPPSLRTRLVLPIALALGFAPLSCKLRSQGKHTVNASCKSEPAREFVCFLCWLISRDCTNITQALKDAINPWGACECVCMCT